MVQKTPDCTRDTHIGSKGEEEKVKKKGGDGTGRKVGEKQRKPGFEGRKVGKVVRQTRKSFQKLRMNDLQE